MGDNNTVEIGRYTTIGDACFLLNNCKNTKVSIGDDCMLSCGITIRTNDGHTIFDNETKAITNKPKDIIIGNHVWIGDGSIILKATIIPSNTIIGARSLINKQFDKENTIIAGAPAKIVKENINWDRCIYDELL